MSGREEIRHDPQPRLAALKYLTDDGKNKLQVLDFLKASRPSGEDGHDAYATGINAPDSSTRTYSPAIKGITGTVQTGKVLKKTETFTLRDDYDFADPSPAGKGYHVNAQLGKHTVAFCSGQNSPAAYYDRTNMAGERRKFDGAAQAAEWYTQGYGVWAGEEEG